MIEATAFYTVITFIAKILIVIIAGIIILLLDVLLDYYLESKNKKKTKMYDIAIMAIYFLLGSIISIIF